MTSEMTDEVTEEKTSVMIGERIEAENDGTDLSPRVVARDLDPLLVPLRAALLADHVHHRQVLAVLALAAVDKLFCNKIYL